MKDCVIVDKKLRQYKGNFHMHTDRSWDSVCPCRQALQEYRSKGFDFCAVTDHEVYWDSDECDDDSFIALSGVESAFILPEAAPEWILCKERFTSLHINLLNDETNGRSGFRHDQVLKRPIDYGIDSWSEYFDYCKKNNQLIIVNHPGWSRLDSEYLLAINSNVAFEVVNSAAYLGGCGTDEGPWDFCLSRGRRLLALSGDDVHRYGSQEYVCGTAFTMLLAEEFSRIGLIKAFKAGRFYPSMGPVIHDMRVVSNVLHLEFSPARQVMIIGRDYACKGFQSPFGELLTSIDWPIKENIKYFRVEIIDEKGRKAWSQAVFPGLWDGRTVALREDPHTPLPEGQRDLQP